MDAYAPPLNDFSFLFEHVTPLRHLVEHPLFAHVEFDVVKGLLDEVGRYATQDVASTNREGDVVGARFDGSNVLLPESFRRIYTAYVQAGWGAVEHAVDHGGGGFPTLVAVALREMIGSANMAFSGCPTLTSSAVHLLEHHGTARQKDTYLPRLVTGEWSGAMDLTEPEAGSDLSAVSTQATPDSGDRYRINGQKIYISFGDHDMASNIVHLVLARLPDAPSGTGGLSLFVVPKFLVDEDGRLGERNDVRVQSIEKKLGIRASPTCFLDFGSSSEGAVAELVGEPNAGMEAMFTMMNDARLGVGVQGVALAERAFQQARSYASGRRQGRSPELDQTHNQAPIIYHADVRRMLLRMQAQVHAARALCLEAAYELDLSRVQESSSARRSGRKVALLTPIAKAWCSDIAVDVASMGVQIHGGIGFIEEAGAAQHYRDARILPIYEGTNGIQGLDLVMRKVLSDQGEIARCYLEAIRSTALELPDSLRPVADVLLDACCAVEEVTDWILSPTVDRQDVAAGATPYLEMFARTLGGWLLGRAAAAADQELAEGATDTRRTDFLQTQIVTALFFATSELPHVRALVPAATAGSSELGRWHRHGAGASS